VLTLLADVSAVLEGADIRHALIGAAALAAHGVTRATADLDLLVTDPRCLDRASWSALVANGIAADVRRGDAADPLAGVVRLTAVDESPVDVVVGRAPWQTAVVERALPTLIGAVTIPLVRPSDLVLLKLYAGGPQDAWDVHQLLDVAPGTEVAVEESLGELPSECAALWRRILGERGHTP
jgi:hypothetical protein